MKKINYQFLYLLLPALLVWVAYYPLNNIPLPNFEDTLYILNNKYLKTVSADNIAAIFSIPMSNSYRPFTFFSYFFNYNAQGFLDAQQIHTTNLWLHLCNTSLVAWLAYLLLRHIGVAVAVALFFGLHPTKVEAIVIGMGRNELLSAFFLLCTLISYIYYRLLQQKWLLGLVMLCLLSSLLSGATALIAPLILVVIDQWQARKVDTTALLGTTALCIAMGIIGGSMVGFVTPFYEFAPTYGFLDNLILIPYTFAFYLFKLVGFTPLAPMYLYPTTFTWYHYLSAVVMLVLGATSFWAFRQQHRSLGFSLLLLFVVFLPIINLYPLGGKVFATDRLLYFPSVAFPLALVALFNTVWVHSKHTATVAGVSLAVLAGLGGYLSYDYLKQWEDHVTLWNRAIDINPTNYHAYALRSNAFCTKATLTDNQFEKIKGEYFRQGMISAMKALEIEPKDVANHYQKLEVHQLLFDYAGADSLMTQIMGMEKNGKNNWKLLFERAEIRAKFNFEEGVKEYTAVIKINPNFAKVYEQRGVLYYALKKYEEALADFEKLVQLAPTYDNAYLRRGSLYHYFKRNEQALQDYNKSLQLNPYNKETYYNRALLLMVMGNQQQACLDIRAAMALGIEKIEPLAKEICGQ